MTLLLLLYVDNPREKFTALLEIARIYFKKRQRCLIQVPDYSSEAFVDKLLWGSSKERHFPFHFSDDWKHELITITRKKENVNEAKTAVNLRKSPCLLPSLNKVYDFYDITTEKKKKESSKRLARYRQLNYDEKPL